MTMYFWGLRWCSQMSSIQGVPLTGDRSTHALMLEKVLPSARMLPSSAATTLASTLSSEQALLLPGRYLTMPWLWEIRHDKPGGGAKRDINSNLRKRELQYVPKQVNVTHWRMAR